MSQRARISPDPVVGLLQRLALATLVCVWLSGCRGEEELALPEHLDIEVRGKDRKWTARYPGKDGVLHTADDRLSAEKVCIPVGLPVTLHLRSDDYVYLFALPHAEISTIAVPDLEYRVDLTADQTGHYKLEGGTMCGRPNTNHGAFVALAAQGFVDWAGDLAR